MSDAKKLPTSLAYCSGNTDADVMASLTLIQSAGEVAEIRLGFCPIAMEQVD